MTRKIAALALAAAALSPAAALAADRPALPPVGGAYAYVAHEGRAGDYMHVVFRTTRPIARGAQQSLQAGLQVEGVGFSIGTVNAKGHVYGAYVPIKGHSIPARAADGTPTRKGAGLGRRFRIVVEGRDGTKVARTVVLRAERPGDDRGLPLTS